MNFYVTEHEFFPQIPPGIKTACNNRHGLFIKLSSRTQFANAVWDFEIGPREILFVGIEFGLCWSATSAINLLNCSVLLGNPAVKIDTKTRKFKIK